MNCAICGKDNQAGTRYCVHCGAALMAPASASQQNTIAAAGAILSPKPPVASGPQQSEPTAAILPYTATARTFDPPPPEQPRAATPAVEPAPAVPAYNADPKKAGLIVIVIAAVGLLAVVAYFGLKVMTNRSTGDVPTRVETPPSKTVPSTQSPAVNETPSPAPEPQKATETSPAPHAPTPETRTAPPGPASSPPATPPKSEQRAPRASSSGQASRQVTPPVAAPPQRPQQPPQQQAPVHAAAPANPVPAAAPVKDRWAQFAEDLQRCQAEVFLSRVVCDQRVRIRYCEGYWGKVPQCPGAIANPDRGQ